MFRKLFLLLLLAGPVVGFFKVDLSRSWSRQEETSGHVAQKAVMHPEALVQIYQAKAYKWQGAVSVRTWIATKDHHARQYVVYEIEGWKHDSDQSVVSITRKAPDHTWFGQAPELIYELSGRDAEAAILKIDRLAKTYPHAYEYEGWFGPNDNTFVAHIVRNVDEIEFGMPPNALGKDYLPDNVLLARTPSNSGYQLNYKGMVGVMLSKDEGFELNLGGLVLGVNPVKQQVKLPGFGAVELSHLFK